MTNPLLDKVVPWDRDQDGSVLRVRAVTPSDSAELALGIARGIYVGVGGDVSFVDIEGNTVLLKNASNGYHPIAMQRVRASGTTATNILALY